MTFILAWANKHGVAMVGDHYTLMGTSGMDVFNLDNSPRKVHRISMKGSYRPLLIGTAGVTANHLLITHLQNTPTALQQLQELKHMSEICAFFADWIHKSPFKGRDTTGIEGGLILAYDRQVATINTQDGICYTGSHLDTLGSIGTAIAILNTLKRCKPDLVAETQEGLFIQEKGLPVILGTLSDTLSNQGVGRHWSGYVNKPTPKGAFISETCQVSFVV